MATVGNLAKREKQEEKRARIARIRGLEARHEQIGPRVGVTTAEVENVALRGDLARIFAVDPGPVESGWIQMLGNRVLRKGKDENENVRRILREAAEDRYDIVLEQVQPYGQVLGWELLITIQWLGQFKQVVEEIPGARLSMPTRKEVVTALCGTAKGGDAMVRARLVDLYGPGERAAKGNKAEPGPLYGISGDMWAALALATWYRLEREQSAELWR